MLKVAALRAAPIAVASWLGITGMREQPAARIMMFHGTPRRTAAELERQLRWLKGRFDIVPLRALAAAALNGSIGRKVALTFDDGLRNNVEVAYPMLHRLGLPATFFVCPGLVDRATWLWNHEARQRLLRLDRGALTRLAAGCEAPDEVEAFVEWMKTLDLAGRKLVEERVRQATPGFSPTPQEHEDFDTASWRDLQRLDAAVVSVGSHTMTHPILTNVAPAVLEEEVRDRRRRLEQGLQRPAELFAYPNGDHDPVVEACVRRHYRTAVIASGGAVRRGAEAYRLPRFAAPRGVLRLARRLFP